MPVTIVQAKVKYPAGKVFPSKYEGKPNRVNVVCTNANNEQIKVWGSEGGALSYLQREQAVTLIYDGNSYELAQDAPAPSTAPIAVPQAALALTPETAEAAWDAKLSQVSARYGKAIEAAIALAQVHLGLTDEEIDSPANRAVIQPMAASLFIETSKR
jgi:hypothetical protein